MRIERMGYLQQEGSMYIEDGLLFLRSIEMDRFGLPWPLDQKPLDQRFRQLREVTTPWQLIKTGSSPEFPSLSAPN